MIKCVIFDLDGTLVDTIEGIAVSMNRVLQDRLLPTHTTETYKRFVGNGLKQLVYKALPAEYRDEKTVVCGYEALLTYYRSYFNQGLSIYQGIGELLDHLVAHDIALAVNTNKHQEMTDWIMGNCFAKSPFVKIIGAESGFEKKPSPQAAHSILDSVGVSPEQCLYIGDSEVDYETAMGAGIKCLLVTWGFRTLEELMSLHNDMIEVPSEVLKYL
ncbi:MAG: HAD family hydrolase [Vallitaleaceae bacterium]|nr:HAD family hydrolase [Vallitaleaceae bacterium]